MEIINRARWGAQYAAGFGARRLPTSEAWLHHTVTLAPDLDFQDLNADSVDDDERDAMRTIERIGQQRFGKGFSYNLAVMPSGRVYEGCGVTRVGAHTGGRNTRSMGIVLVGNYERDPVPQPMLDAVVALLQHAHRQGWIDQPKFDGGHRDLKATGCPGINAYNLLPEINRRAAGAPVQHNVPSKPEPSQPTPTVEVNVASLPLVAPGRGMNLRDGDAHVRIVQSLLIAHRHDLSQEGGIDGKYGPGLEREIKAFQGARGLAADGLVGENTWTWLIGATP